MASIHLLFDPKNDWLMPFVFPELDVFRIQHSVSTGVCARHAAGFDVLFILGYTSIISNEILSSNGLNLVIHESALPKGRGFSPVQWQVLEGASSISVCLIEATSDADAGDIFDTTTMSLEGHELWPDIRRIQAKATILLIERFLRGYPSFRRTSQFGEPSTYPRRRLDDDSLDVDKTIRQQFNHLRIADNDRFPVYFDIDGHRYTIRITRSRAANIAPPTKMDLDDNKF